MLTICYCTYLITVITLFLCYTASGVPTSEELGVSSKGDGGDPPIRNKTGNVMRYVQIYVYPCAHDL